MYETQSCPPVVHVVAQAVALAQAKFPGHGVGVRVAHVPAPLHACAGVSIEPVQEAALPQAVPDG